MALLLLIASYALDWALLIIFAALGYVVGNLTPNKRPFYLGDPDIDFPYKGYDTVSVAVLFVVSVIAPAAIIFLAAITVTPAHPATKSSAKALAWKRKLWEWHAGWLGLALSVVTAWFLTSGMKNLLGKPRPNLLGRCQPDSTNIANYFVDAAANAAKESRLVSANICQNTDKSVLDEGFRSFPSGHSTVAASGLVYLSLVLAAKLGTGSPFLPYSWGWSRKPAEAGASHHHGTPGSVNSAGFVSLDDSNEYQQVGEVGRIASAARSQASAPPLYLFILSFIPLLAALFIACSRWYDFQHHGFDIIAGFAVGTATSVFAFRYYYLPLGRGVGWAWGPRSAEHAFWIPAGSRHRSEPNPSNHDHDVTRQQDIGVADDAGAATGGETYQLRFV